ncbi:MAG: ABC transporter transmembrane domain-containing protein [Bacteroidales bacterium]|nr:ABC transporter transmembrane domain-containing protein [Bacteroidales bacterium]MDD4057721.1 ABC transporter transmembrane domain-containing protein [Bacteroidales bacterium]
MNTFKRLLAYARPHRYYWPLYLILSVLGLAFSLVNFALFKPLLVVVFNPETLRIVESKPEFSMSIEYINDIFQYYLGNVMSSHGILRGLAFVCVMLIIFTFLAGVIKYMSQRVIVRVRVTIMQRIREDLFRKISSLHIGYFTDKRKGDILSSISNDVTEVQNSVANSFHVIFRDPLQVLGFLAALIYMSPKLTVITLVTLPVSAFIITRITRSLRRGAIDTQMYIGRILSQFEEAISGSRIIKAFNAQRYVRRAFNDTNEAHKNSSKKMYYRQEMASPFSEFMGISIAVAILFFAGYMHITGRLGMDLPTLMIYIAFYWKVLEPAKSISNTYAMIQRGLVSGERIFAILDEPVAIKKAENPVRIEEFKDSIEFKEVSFKYNNEPVLKNISFKVEKGKMIALVGPSGAGKTTLVDLIPRYYDVTSGSIFLDGVDIRDYAPRDLIGLMGIVTQEAILFNDSVYNNITFGLQNVKREDVIAAAKIANAHDFIMQMESGYETNIGDRGGKLSGGQRQRLAIARAVLKNPPVLILDEATSALDTESERLVQEALTNLMRNRTSIVIAHRLSTIQHADEIIVLKEGEIVETGSHNNLIKQKGLYSHLCKLQTFE